MISSDLLSIIDNELHWREAELALLKIQVQRDLHDNVRFGCSYRAFIALTYAHYEGFMKLLVAQSFVEIKRTTAIGDCASSIILRIAAPSLRKFLSEASNADLITHIKNGGSTLNLLTLPSEQKFFEISNLNIPKFDELVESIGIDSSKFMHYRRYIATLVNTRHQCAHGQKLIFDSSKSNSDIAKDAFHLQSEILNLMHDVAVEVVDLFEGSAYLEASARSMTASSTTTTLP